MLVQRFRLFAQRSQGIVRLAGQSTGFASRFLQAENRRISRFLRGRIFPRALAQFLTRLRDIENVVDHLESEPERITEIADARELRRGGVRTHRAEPHRSGQQCCGLVFMDVTELRRD